jgi:hypothetical protein
VSDKESDAIRFVGLDSLKRSSTGTVGAGFPSVIVHTSVEFGATYVNTDMKLVEPIILEQLKRLYPTLPPPVETKCHKWRYSQVTEAYHGPEPFIAESIRETPKKESAGATSAVSVAAAATSLVGAVMVIDKPALVLAGDAFVASNFEGCIASAEKVRILTMYPAFQCHTVFFDVMGVRMRVLQAVMLLHQARLAAATPA